MSRSQDRAVAARPAALSGKDRYQRFLDAEARRGQAMAPEREVSAADLARVILADLDRRRGRDGDWRIEPRPVRGRDSWVFRAQTPLAPWPLAVKVYCDAVPVDDVAAQAEHLRRYHEQMGTSPHLAVPAFWDCLPEHRTLLMQWIEAPRMDELMRRAGGRQAERAKLFAAAGAWLGHYHAQSDPIMRPLRVTGFPRHIDMLLGGEAGAGGHVRDAVFRRSYQALVERADAVAGLRTAHVTAHGDFVAHNLFHGEGRTVGFDMVPRLRPALGDICHFLVHAELKKPVRPGFSRLGPTGLGRQDVEAFLDAYGGLEPLGGAMALAYMQLNEALLRWAVIISHLRRAGRRRPEHLISWLRYRRMARAAAAALGQGDDPRS